jgi:hypothetical protein
MVRFTMLALLATLAATDGRVLAPETSAELVSAFTTVRSGDTIKLKSTAYTIDQQLSMTKVFGVKVEGARDGTVIKASKKTRVLYLYQTQSLSFKGVVFANGRVDVSAPAETDGQRAFAAARAPDASRGLMPTRGQPLIACPYAQCVLPLLHRRLPRSTHQAQARSFRKVRAWCLTAAAGS